MKRPVSFGLRMKTTFRIMGVVGAVALAATLTTSLAQAQSATEAQELKLDQQRDRTTLPPPESPFKGKIETAMKDSTQDWPRYAFAIDGGETRAAGELIADAAQHW